MNTFIILVNLCCFINCMSAFAQTAPVISQKRTKQEVIRSIKEVRGTEKESVADILSLLEHEPIQDESEEARVELEFHLLEAALKHRDRTFDPSKVKVYFHAEPPPGYDSGVSPQAVKDPKQRADYERRIRENETIGRKVNDHYTLERVINSTLLHLKRRTRSPDQKPEARAALEAVGKLLDASTIKASEKDTISKELGRLPPVKSQSGTSKQK